MIALPGGLKNAEALSEDKLLVSKFKYIDWKTKITIRITKMDSCNMCIAVISFGQAWIYENLGGHLSSSSCIGL